MSTTVGFIIEMVDSLMMSARGGEDYLLVEERLEQWRHSLLKEGENQGAPIDAAGFMLCWRWRGWGSGKDITKGHGIAFTVSGGAEGLWFRRSRYVEGKRGTWREMMSDSLQSSSSDTYSIPIALLTEGNQHMIPPPSQARNLRESAYHPSAFPYPKLERIGISSLRLPIPET
jgi:hypothetical protein